MQIGLIGLGKMGLQLALNCMSRGHEIIAYDLHEGARSAADKAGITVVNGLDELVRKIKGPRIVWMMINAGVGVDELVLGLMPLLQQGDTIIDGGNSYYKDSIRRAALLEEKGISFLDCGSSGGVEGARNGLCLMIGGTKKAFDNCEQLFQSISLQDGYLYCGESGSGHFAKMVHNGIEYGMMQSIAEGFELIKHSGFSYDHRALAAVWNHGSVIRSWLMELTEKVFAKEADLDSIKGIIHSSGEGKWMVEAALEKQVSSPVIALSLLMRYRSLHEENFAGKLVAALRNEFGGHAVVRVNSEW